MQRSAKRSIKHFGISSSSRLHLALSPDYIAGKMLILRALIADCELTFESPSSSPLSEANTNDKEITLISLVGSQLQGLYQRLQQGSLPPIRHLLLGGAPLNDTMRQMAANGPWQAWESYGMTETASHVALRRITSSPQPFEALPGISFSLNDDNCLCINLAEDGIIKTNDIAILYDSTHFDILGRKDNVIITGALKVFPEEVEAIIAPYIASRRFYITSRPSQKWGNELILIIEGNEIPIPDFHDIPQLKPHQRPKSVLFLPKLSLTSTGKIIRTSYAELSTVKS